jgi:hypothetical protein
LPVDRLGGTLSNHGQWTKLGSASWSMALEE